MSNNYNVKCYDCGKRISISYSAWNRAIHKDPGDPIFRCRECMVKYRGICVANYYKTLTPEEKERKSKELSKRAKLQFQNLSDEDKEKTRNFLRNMYNDMSEEDKKKHAEKSTAWMSNMTDEEKIKYSNKKREIWNNKSDKEKEQASLRMKEWWKNLSDEEKVAYKNKKREIWNNLPPEAKQAVSDRMKSRHDELSKRSKMYWESLSKDEQNQKIKYLHQKHSEWHSRLSDEEKVIVNNKISTGLANMDDNKRAEMIRKQREAKLGFSKEKKAEINRKRKETIDNLPDDVKNIYAERHRQSVIGRYVDMSDEERERLSENAKKRWDNMSEEKKQKIINNSINYWNSKTDSELEELSKRMKTMWANKSDEEKLLIRDKHSKWFVSLSDKDKAIYRQHLRDAWGNMPDDRKYEITKNKMTSSSGNNKLHQKFESYFDNSYISNDYHIKPEVVLSNNNIMHSWDYGIYDKDNNLIMVVDLDGEFFHADRANDYDGIHSHEEYDEKRSLSVPDGVSIFIIQELNFSKCFELMIKQLMLNYDEFIQNIFNTCRMMPFPYPKYSDDELIKSYNHLLKMNCNDKYHQDVSLNTRVGDHIIQHFHESVWHARRKGDISPYDAWYNDDMLIRVIKNRVIYQSYLNPNKILQGFNVSRMATKVSVFSAGRAKMLINRYLSEYDTVFDPFSGFSGRMLGTISLGKRYIGQDASEIHIREGNKMLEFLNMYGIKYNATMACMDVLKSYGTYQCLFTCPPYEDKEQWQDVSPDTRSCDDWIDICLEHFECERYLFVVDNTEKYKDHIINIIMNKSHFGCNNEYVILI